ncbi:hypothetical protein [Nibricoccus sp. IMCC34717]|uniref:hypothetical protein n=1 Tax=Nibricoccus sp. IMCC34717 TaxID=3034021 RepID=UPI00384B4AA0
MKSFRHLLALLAVSFLFVGFVNAGDKQCDKGDKAKCECGTDKDGKKCGKDKPCCCEHKEEKK